MGPLGEFVNYLAKYPIITATARGGASGEGRPPDRAATESSCNRQCPNLDLHGFRLPPRRGFLRPSRRPSTSSSRAYSTWNGGASDITRATVATSSWRRRKRRRRGAMMDHPPPSPSRRRRRLRRRRRRPRRLPRRRPRRRPSSSSTPRIWPRTRRDWSGLHEPRRVRGFRRLRPRWVDRAGCIPPPIPAACTTRARSPPRRRIAVAPRQTRSTASPWIPRPASIGG